VSCSNPTFRNGEDHDSNPIKSAKQADTNAIAAEDAILSPRFYTTDFKQLDALDVSPVRREWDQLISEMREDRNRDHFRRDKAFDLKLEELPEGLRQEFVDFLVSSLTAEFSGALLYSEIRKRVSS